MVKHILACLFLLGSLVGCAAVTNVSQFESQYRMKQKAGVVGYDWSIEGDSFKHLIRPMEAYSRSLGITVHYVSELQDDFGIELVGRYFYGSRDLYINDRYPLNTQVAAFSHELAHALTPADGPIDATARDIFAETVSCLVLKQFGFETDSKTFAYLQYQELSQPSNFFSTIQRYEKMISATANRLASGIKGQM